ncbi:GPW/gp25 family protein [Oxynema sp. CENA135]|jgi:phage baseplate assembly protein W|uniref:GPW/gp25 family protein n=1 Tax=Oxynema aestuarii AP17 TaxID=2064643 RepID=A0A6H1TW49_9CYAN|nr:MULTISPECIES: GPW/gp25 family protein [Oxynema]MBK4728862.1 GPW/gp25 family protein [Oxynema sp. CENA135]QIZ70426.1 GPW/gp25 family protein [Oxynema aestuarii AP17]RMH70973.1 MAG: baseplate protein [Cyanobacteria bacterium J007]
MSDRPHEASEDYLGTGWSFPLKVNLQGSIQLSSSSTNIEESIRIILGTRLGERVYRPNFGSRLSELVFAPMNTQTLLLIRLYVEEAIQMWEPRVVLEGVFTEPDPIRGRVDITIKYHPKDSYDSRSIIYGFYLLPPMSAP